jgi:hypothetical protein
MVDDRLSDQNSICSNCTLSTAKVCDSHLPNVATNGFSNISRRFSRDGHLQHFAHSSHHLTLDGYLHLFPLCERQTDASDVSCLVEIFLHPGDPDRAPFGSSKADHLLLNLRRFGGVHKKGTKSPQQP